MPKRLYFETTETITRKRKGWVEVDTDFTQVYSCFSQISAHINSATSWKLLFWLLASETGEKNGIVIERSVWERFGSYLADFDSSVSYRGFQKCIHELYKAGALTRYSRGRYYFNPHIFWKENINQREEFIKAENTEGKNLSYNPVESVLKIA